MKKLVVAVILIVASLFVAPKFIGSVVEQEREKVLIDINKVDGISLTTNKFTSGWFGADVTSEVIINLEEEGLADITLTLEETFSFGPVIITAQGWHLGLGYSEMTFKLLSAEVDEDLSKLIHEKLHLGALLSFNNDVTAFIKTDELSYENEGDSIVSAPSKTQFTFINNQHIKGNFSWGGLEINGTEERLVIGKVTMSTEQEVVSGDYLEGTAILIGDASFEVKKVEVYSQSSPVFSLNDAGLTSVVSLNNDLLALDLKYHAKDILASGQNFQKPNMEIMLTNIDMHALQELNTTMSDFSSSYSAQSNSTGNPNDNSEEILKALSVIANKILAKDPNLKVSDLSVVTEEGKIESEFNFTVNKDLFDLTNPNTMALVVALEADAKGKVPMGFLAKFGVAAFAENFVEQGYLSKQEDKIIFDAKYVQSQLTLNGKAFQL